MASKKVNIQIDTRADTSGAKKAEDALDSLSSSSRKVEEASGKAAAGTSKIGTVATQAGFQVQDFAVQIAGGTSALTAMAQQAPQFLGVFGPGGAIAGALIAVGAVATKVFMTMADDSAAAAENAAVLADAVEQIGENAAKAIGEDIDFGLSQLIAAAEEAESLIDAYDRVTQAQNASATASLANAEKIRQAEVELARLRGENVDELAAISAELAAEDAARTEIARQQIAAQNEQLAKARQQEEIARQVFEQSSAIRADAESQRATEAEKLELLRQQREELTKQAKERVTLAESLAQGGLPFIKTQDAERAQRQLEDPAFQALIASTEARVNALDAQLQEQGGKLTEAVNVAARALEEAMLNTSTIAETLAIEIPRIEQTLQADTVKAQVQGLAEIGRTAAEEITAIAESAKPQTTGQAAALETLKAATADNIITANETAKVAAALQALGTSINTGITGVNTNVTTLINAMNTLNARVLEQKRQIDSLNARIRSGN
jgi:hypothetical protein